MRRLKRWSFWVDLILSSLVMILFFGLIAAMAAPTRYCGNIFYMYECNEVEDILVIFMPLWFVAGVTALVQLRKRGYMMTPGSILGGIASVAIPPVLIILLVWLAFSDTTIKSTVDNKISPNDSMNIVYQLEKLNVMREKEIITDEEYRAAKAKILG